MKTWMRRVVPLFAFAIAPLAHAEAPAAEAIGGLMKDRVVAGAKETSPSGVETPQVRELSEMVDRLARRVAELETKQEKRDANLGDAQDHGGWW
jgi:hypothetical protein